MGTYVLLWGGEALSCLVGSDFQYIVVVEFSSVFFTDFALIFLFPGIVRGYFVVSEASFCFPCPSALAEKKCWYLGMWGQRKMKHIPGFEMAMF